MPEQLWDDVEYRGYWMQTVRGSKFWPLNPRSKDIDTIGIKRWSVLA
jgi:hypothetical protein